MKKTVGNKREYHVTCWLTHTKATRNRSTKAPCWCGDREAHLVCYISRDGLTWTHHRGELNQELNFPCWSLGHARTNTKPAFQVILQSVATLLTLFPLSSPVSPPLPACSERFPIVGVQYQIRSWNFEAPSSSLRSIPSLWFPKH
jgi:hypothetical protein